MKKSAITHISETTRGYHEAGPLYLIIQANVKNNETSATPDLTARSNHKNYNNQTTIKHQSGTRKIKDSQTNLLNVD